MADVAQKVISANSVNQGAAVIVTTSPIIVNYQTVNANEPANLNLEIFETKYTDRFTQ